MSTVTSVDPRSPSEPGDEGPDNGPSMEEEIVKPTTPLLALLLTSCSLSQDEAHETTASEHLLGRSASRHRTVETGGVTAAEHEHEHGLQSLQSRSLSHDATVTVATHDPLLIEAASYAVDVRRRSRAAR